MKKYENYKDSGIEWIGEIPEHWKVTRLKFLADHVRTGSTPPSENKKYYSNGDIDWYGPGDFKQLVLGESKRKITQIAIEEGKCKLIEENSILLVGIGATVGKIGIVRNVCASNQQINAIKFNSNRINSDYAVYYLSSIKQIIVGEADSATLPIFNQTQTKELIITLPPFQEQTQIANYLDHKTTQINELISKKERLIDLLQEELTAVINQAVTKGLDSTVPMKDSGVEWLGEIPAHWEACHFKRITKRIEVGIAEAATQAYVEEGGVPILRSTNIKDGEIEGNILQINEAFAEKNKSKTIFKNDLVTVRTGYPGVTALVKENLHGCQCFTMLITTLEDNTEPRFYNYLLNSYVGKSYFKLTAWGSAQKNISVPILSFAPIVKLSFDEQILISDFLDNKVFEFDLKKQKVEQEVNLLKEYKTALISEVVTGKVDVRDEILN